ncbi:hypothetical protein PBI_PBS1_247 [Bacillus phage PBS1]|uniref:Uncharacterized protein n=1 Tax=Bacillus phage PBS1 TaxID=2884423 RepID=A0A223LEZ1_BPPB1|nr:virion structural protein [Bacillus phage PBS1]ASU00069.1 hypothetical protein PBI_PBS1_247 [Bacillus phage PBS1]BDE75421.1 hypothetical protein [Bacillus phage PBS1]
MEGGSYYYYNSSSKNNMALVDYNLRSNDKFYYTEGSTSVGDLIKNVANEFVTKAGTEYAWTLESPSAISNVTNKVILSTTTSFGKTFYLKIFRPETTDANNVVSVPLTYVNMAIGTEFNAETEDLVEGKVSPVTKLSWYKDDIDPSIKSWLPVSYWMNITKDAVNLVFRGDPSADNYPYKKFLVGYAYIGAVTPLEDGQSPDVEYNFGITTSSASEPVMSNAYGPRTGTGITDILMVANKIGMPYQPHYPSFYGSNQFMDKMNIEGSRWNNQKHQFSDITVTHSIDMERGKMQNILVGDNSALYDNDKLVYKEGTTEQLTYKKFQISAPYSFLNNSSNTQYCIAIRCYNPDGISKVEDGTTAS